MHMSFCWFYHAVDHITLRETKTEKSHWSVLFDTGTENTIQVSKFKRIGLEKNVGFRCGGSVSTYSIINLH